MKFWRRFNQDHKFVLAHLAAGSCLKSHRDLNGRKIYRLYPLNGKALDLSSQVVDALKSNCYIDSNKKFPSATYLLTDRGLDYVNKRWDVQTTALAARNYR